jgi:hypothetical protein
MAQAPLQQHAAGNEGRPGDEYADAQRHADRVGSVGEMRLQQRPEQRDEQASGQDPAVAGGLVDLDGRLGAARRRQPTGGDHDQADHPQRVKQRVAGDVVGVEQLSAPQDEGDRLGGHAAHHQPGDGSAIAAQRPADDRLQRDDRGGDVDGRIDERGDLRCHGQGRGGHVVPERGDGERDRGRHCRQALGQHHDADRSRARVAADQARRDQGGEAPPGDVGEIRRPREADHAIEVPEQLPGDPATRGGGPQGKTMALAPARRPAGEQHASQGGQRRRRPRHIPQDRLVARDEVAGDHRDRRHGSGQRNDNHLRC